MCEDYKLDWNLGPFKILGVTFTPEVFGIWDQNTTYILKKVENIFKKKLGQKGDFHYKGK